VASGAAAPPSSPRGGAPPPAAAGQESRGVDGLSFSINFDTINKINK
jgi:hypothetical protein